jgi:hypothetical protein
VSIDLAAVYMTAADIIRVNGHAKGHYFNRPESGVGIELSARECPPCVAGAISIVLTDWPVPMADDESDLDDYEGAVLRLTELLDLERDPMLEPVARLAAWNDADERTQGDVIAALENAAKAVA